ncbi:MAG: hypothetical protein ACI854_001386 [Arenicella sp.]|jgi:hypothetical protein
MNCIVCHQLGVHREKPAKEIQVSGITATMLIIVSLKRVIRQPPQEYD